MHEIVTLQLGQQANHVGTHVWNAQESYFTYGQDDESPVDHDVSFRPGLAPDGSETYTPRTLIYDLKGAFGTLRRENALYESADDPAAVAQQMWDQGGMQVIRSEQIPGSEYQDRLERGLDAPQLTAADVRFWSDYNRVYYHPRSLVQLAEFEVNSSIAPFEKWATGEELFTSLDREHDLLDRDLRLFLEECDQLQALQMMASTDDAWGGFAARYIERIRDDLGKTSVWVWGLEDGARKTRDKKLIQTANVAQSLHSIATQASIYVPMTTNPSTTPSYLSMDSSSRWHTSALQAMAIESTMLPTRLRASTTARCSMTDYEAVLSNNGTRKIATVGANVKQPSEEETNGRFDATSSLDIDFLPEAPKVRKNHTFSTVASLRGKWLPQGEVERANVESRSRFASAVTTQIQTDLLFPVLDSFPAIFNLPGKTLEVQTRLSTSTLVSQKLRALESFARSAIGIDEREALCDGLVTMSEEYDEGWEDGLDSSDDDL